MNIIEVLQALKEGKKVEYIPTHQELICKDGEITDVKTNKTITLQFNHIWKDGHWRVCEIELDENKKDI